MDTIFEHENKLLVTNKFINKALEIVKKADLGFSSTGCLEQQLCIASILYNCAENDVMFNDVQQNNLNIILNSI